MKNRKMILGLFLIPAMLLMLLTGCGSADDPNTITDVNTPGADVNTPGADDGETREFTYSDSIDENGLWEGVRALDYVEMFNYQAMSIPADIHYISDDDLQNEIDGILSEYAAGGQITDRAVAEGDTVNIDYVGSVDGVEFSGGSTGGAGTDVTAGSTDYIDDFLFQIIGHMPGETFDVEVTFPEEYGVDDLNGKDAVFVTTINYIAEALLPEKTDEFVAENLYADYGWETIAEMTDATRSTLQETAVQDYINQYFITDVVVKSVPDQLVKYQEDAMVAYYQGYAEMYGMELDEFLTDMVGVSGVDELIASNSDGSREAAVYSLIIQAVAEDAGISVTDGDLSDYFAEYTGTDDYSDYEQQYGLPYLKQVVLSQKVLDYILNNAVLE